MITTGQILKGSFWPEPVRVLQVKEIGNYLKIEAVGEQTKQFYSQLISIEDLGSIQLQAPVHPNFLGNGESFFLGIEAHRIRYAQQFDPLFAVNVSQVDPLPHQIEAIYHYILKNPRIRFLLADDPGAGKTIMTGLLLKELKYRGLVKRILIVVPGHLKDQWFREMKEKFSETFTFVDRSVMNATWGQNVWLLHNQIITSMDFAKQEDVLATLAEVEWDMVVIDEAHKLAAYKYGEKTKKTARYKLGEVLSRRSHFLLFLTATPHKGDPENFRLFLDLLEPGFFATTDLLIESVKNKENPLFLRRLKEDLKDFNGRPLFPPRKVITKKYFLNDEEKRLYNAVTRYVEEHYNKALSTEKRNVAFALLILQRRMASSVRAVRKSLERRKAKLSELLKLGKWLSEKGEIDEEELEDSPESERIKKEEELLERLTSAETREELEEEINHLSKLINLAREAERHEIETKLNELKNVLNDEKIRERKEKFLIFTESRETLEYLAEKLRKWGYTVTVLHGGMSLDARIQAEHEFSERSQIMVSTEAGGEGINLQFCALMMNYDIPWNPNRLEQRMGRIHRYGQQKEVHIYNLVAADTREGRVLDALFRKLERIQEALGSDRVFDVIGEIIPGKSLKDLIVDAISHRRTLEDIIKDIEATPDTEAIRKVKEAVLEGLATRHIDLAMILGEQRKARENRLVPEYIESFFKRACFFLNIPIERRTDGVWRIQRVPYEIRNVSFEFKNKYGQVFSEYKKVAFDKETARTKESIFVAPGHPLLEAIIERIFAKVWNDLQGGAQFTDPDGNMDGFIWFVEGEIRDGSNQVAGKKIFAVFESLEGELKLIHPAILWDLVPIKSPQKIEVKPLNENRILSFVMENALEEYRKEIEIRRRHDTEIKKKYGIRSLEQMIVEEETKLLEYETRKAKGEHVPEVLLMNTERRLEELKERKRQLEESLNREVSLLPSTPKIIGIAYVTPMESIEMQSDREIELVGMQIAMAYERKKGREPRDVSHLNLGYDIVSTGSDNSVRYIEVKARASQGPIVLTPNERLMAQRMKEDYWLYIVVDAATSPKLYLINNPVDKIDLKEIKDTVRFMSSNWRNSAVLAD